MDEVAHLLTEDLALLILSVGETASFVVPTRGRTTRAISYALIMNTGTTATVSKVPSYSLTPSPLEFEQTLLRRAHAQILSGHVKRDQSDTNTSVTA